MSNSRQIAALPNILTLIDDAGGQFIKQQAAGVTTSYTITWPSALGASGSVLGFTDSSGSLGWLTSAPKATIFFIYPLLCDPSQYPLGFDVFPHPHIGLSILFIIILLMLLLILYHLELTCLQGFERKCLI